MEITNINRIVGFFLLALACAQAQTIVISGPARDPEVKPEQRTATIVHYEQMRASARRTIRTLSLALQNMDSPKPILTQAINNEQDIVDSANWCIVALRDKIPGGEMCMLTRAPSLDQAQKGVCELAANPVVRSHCSGGSTHAINIRNQ